MATGTTLITITAKGVQMAQTVQQLQRWHDANPKYSQAFVEPRERTRTMPVCCDRTLSRSLSPAKRPLKSPSPPPNRSPRSRGFRVGDRVRVRGFDNERWYLGTVTSTDPVLVKLDGSDYHCRWKEIQAVNEFNPGFYSTRRASSRSPTAERRRRQSWQSKPPVAAQLRTASPSAGSTSPKQRMPQLRNRPSSPRMKRSGSPTTSSLLDSLMSVSTAASRQDDNEAKYWSFVRGKEFCRHSNSWDGYSHDGGYNGLSQAVHQVAHPWAFSKPAFHDNVKAPTTPSSTRSALSGQVSLNSSYSLSSLNSSYSLSAPPTPSSGTTVRQLR